MSYRKKLASFRTIEMLPIYPVIPDSLKFQGDAQMQAEMDVQDSTGAVQDPPLHPGLIGPKFNVEQENYMYYFRKILVLPDVRESMATQAASRKKRGFFSRLFNRKNKSDAAGTQPDSTAKQPFFKRIFSKKNKETETAEVAPSNNAQANPPDDQPAEEKTPFFQRIFGKKKESSTEDDTGDNNN